MTAVLLAAAAFASALDVAAVRTPYARILIPAAVDPGPQGTYPDLRVRNERGAEVPYVVWDSDPAALIASSEKIRSELAWQPEFQDLRVIIQSAWKWLCAHPQGYEE